MRGRSRFYGAGALGLALSVAALLPTGAQAQSIAGPVNVQQAAGTSVAAIQSAVDAYRNDLGTLNTAGPAAAGRREIAWDGVPDAQSAPNLLPADFFNATVPRGVIFSTTRRSRFQVSANAGVAPVEFDNLNPTYSKLFTTFSPQRLFTPLDTNEFTIRFFVPGTRTPATTAGFGAVFTDVDRPGTRITYYNAANRVLGSFAVPISPGSETLSFLGVRFLSARVASVKITSGNTRPGSNETRIRDAVVMDDFIFGEPTP